MKERIDHLIMRREMRREGKKKEELSLGRWRLRGIESNLKKKIDRS